VVLSNTVLDRGPGSPTGRRDFEVVIPDPYSKDEPSLAITFALVVIIIVTWMKCDRLGEGGGAKKQECFRQFSDSASQRILTRLAVFNI